MAGPLRVWTETETELRALQGPGLASPDPPIPARGCQGQASAALDSSVDNASRIPPQSVCVCGGWRERRGPLPILSVRLRQELCTEAEGEGCPGFQAQSPAPHFHLVTGLLAGDGRWGG